MNEDFYIGQIFDGVYPPEAAIWCNANNALIIKTGSVMRVVSEEYEETIQKPIKYSAITHIEIDEDGNEHKIIDEPEHEEIIEEVVVKTREVEKEVRQYQIVATPEPTVEEKNEQIRKTRAALYTKHVDPLHAEKQRKVVIGIWTEEMEAEYVAKVKKLTEQIQTENPYVETMD